MIRFQGETARGIDIGNNVLMGGNIMIVDGVTIGDGCVIGSGSVVTKDLPANTISYGVPCRVIKEREKPYWLFENTLGGE
jgi:acetyltransferase-like isoleucine patch superfamily enzyme